MSALALANVSIAAREIVVATRGQGFHDITAQVAAFVTACGARDGVVLLFLRHTSASLVIQENADPDVLTDLGSALDNLAPRDAPWVHDSEGRDDMPGHIRTMLTGVSLHVPVLAGRMALGTWQGIYLAEHRDAPHTRKVVLQFLGSMAA